MAQICVTPQAQRDVGEAISALTLPGGTWARIARSLRTLETFRWLVASWAGTGTGPIRTRPLALDDLALQHEDSSDRGYVVAMHDGQSATSAIAVQR